MLVPTFASRPRARATLIAVVLGVVLAVAFAVLRWSPSTAPGTPLPTGPMEIPDQWMNAQRLGPDGAPPPAGAHARARAEAVRMERLNPAVSGRSWAFQGPANIGGRITDIVVDPELDDTLYVTAATGGVWRSSDAADTFEPIWPHDWTQSMGALAIDSQGTLYAGTGETNPGGGSTTFGGTGVYKSTDRGASWQLVGLEDSSRIGDMHVDPSDDDTIWVAASGDLFRPGGQRGIYKSSDGGESWQRVLAGANDTTGGADIAIDPSDPDTVYVAMWDHLREPDRRLYGGEGSGIWKTTDGGASWERLTGGLPTGADVGRPSIGVSATNPDRLYSVQLTAVGPFEGFYRSDDAGETWQEMDVPGSVRSSQSTFGWWFGEMWIDPTDADHVFVPGVSMPETTDGGETWGTSRGIHADQQAMAWDPKVPGRVYLGNDGGMYRSDENGADRTWIKAGHEPYTQFYTVDVAQTDPSRFVGGTQDNGCNRSFPGAWQGFGCGDGLQTLIDPRDADKHFGCSQYGNCSAYDLDGRLYGVRGPGERRNWLTPLQFDPSDPDVMYYGSEVLSRSTDQGRSWTQISPELALDEGRDPGGYPFGTITTVAVSASDPEVIYVGTDDALMWTTKDQGQTWTQVDQSQYPDRWVTRIAVDPHDADIAYATFSGFRSGDDTAHVMKTTDGGRTWDDITGNLPNAPVNNVTVVEDGFLVVASDVGVFLSTFAGKTWAPFGKDLPAAPITYLSYHEDTRTVQAATFGRGIYQLELPRCPGLSYRTGHMAARGKGLLASCSDPR